MISRSVLLIIIQHLDYHMLEHDNIIIIAGVSFSIMNHLMMALTMALVLTCSGMW